MHQMNKALQTRGKPTYIWFLDKLFLKGFFFNKKKLHRKPCWGIFYTLFDHVIYDEF